MSSPGLLNIMQHYARTKDAGVRSNLCDALVADGSPESAELLLDLATKDPDASVNTFATDQISRLNAEQLHAVQPSVAGRFDPKKGKDHILNWVRCADRIAKGTQTSLFEGFGNWWKEVRATRKLNRRLLLSRKNEYSFAARLLNRYVLLSSLLAILLTWALGAILITNPSDGMIIAIPFVAFAAVLLGGIPLAIMFAPPDVAFRRSAMAFVDATTLLKYAAFGIVLVVVFAQVVEPGSLDESFFGPVLLYLVLPMFCVRLALNAALRVKQRLGYPLALCLIVLGVLVGVYSVLLWVLDMIDPRWYDQSEIMSIYLWATVPMSMFLALHQGSRGNVIRDTGETARTMFYYRLRCRVLTGIAVAFLLALSVASTTGVNPPGQGEGLPIILLAQDSDILAAKTDAEIEAEADIAQFEEDVLATIERLLKQAERAETNRLILVGLQEMAEEIRAGTSARRLRELSDGLLDTIYTRAALPDNIFDYETLATQMIDLAAMIEARAPAATTEPVGFDRSQRLEFRAAAEGDLELTASAYRVTRETDDTGETIESRRATNVVLWVNGRQIDDRSWSDPEIYQGAIGEGLTTVYADTPAPSVSAEEIVLHFQDKIAYVVNRYILMNAPVADANSGDPLELKFEVQFVWTPKTAPLK
ncbi:MAG: hypothetical protein AAF252_01970 [Pseudomonadota bacterium]